MSDLRSRLGVLRRESGAVPPGHEGNRGADTMEALRRHVRRIESRARRRPRPPEPADDGRLAEALGGRLVAPGVVAMDEIVPDDRLHGRHRLAREGLFPGLDLCGLPAGNRPRDCVFMDTETTGLSGGTGTIVFLLGLARFRDAGLEVMQLLLTGFHGESALLEAARRFVAGADGLVTFNGRSFDAPLLAARYRLAGLADPFAALPHLDLLAPTRRAFRRRWPDCRLQTAERRLLGFERVDDLPGSEAPVAWFDWVRHRHADLLPAVCTHNRLDVLSLVVLPAALQWAHDDPVAEGADARAGAEHRRRAGGERAAFDYLRRHRDGLDTVGLLELARTARRLGCWPVAVEIWQRLAGEGVSEAIEHLAKYLEHQRGDLQGALDLTARLLAGAPEDARHLRRDARLRTRLARARR